MESTTQSVDHKAGAGPGRGLAPGFTIAGRYAIEAFVGKGPYGDRYRGKDTTDGSSVAVLVVAASLTQDPQKRARLDRELAIARQLTQKNVAQIFEVVEIDLGAERAVCIVSEHVDGQTLREMVDKRRQENKTFSARGAYNVLAHLSNALTYAHEHTVHGGISLETVYVNSAGRVKLVDFGLPRAQVAVASPATDLQSLGTVLNSLIGAGSNSPSVTQFVQRALSAGAFADARAFKESLQQAFAGEVDGLSNQNTPAPQIARQMTPQAPATQMPAPMQSSVPPISQSMPRASGPLPGMGGPSAMRPVSKSNEIDERAERWLIQKDGLDFGPFSLLEVKAQIDSGKVHGGHMLCDTDTGDKRRVKDHPELRAMVTDAEVKFAEMERQKTLDDERRSKNKRVVTLLLAIFVVLVAGGGGAFWYIKNMKPQKETVVIREKAEDLDFFKNMTISLKMDPPPPKKPKVASGPRKRNAKGEFDNVTNLGDANEEGGDETLDQTVINRVMQQNFKVLVGCIGEERKRSGASQFDMAFIVRGTGLTSAVKVNGSTDSAVARCALAKMQSVQFPKFNGSKTTFTFSLGSK